jgi:hypothetical protein
MRKTILISSAVLVLAALVFAANDAWKKPYQQWDQKDVRKILDDSPWAKVVQIDANWKNSKDAPDNSAPSGPAASAPAGGGKMGGQSPGAYPSGGGGTPAASGSDTAAQASFVIRWVSSLTLRRAAARNAELAGQLKPEDAEKELAQPVDIYGIALVGPDMRPFQSADDDTLVKSAALIEKKTKQKISPTKVQVSRAPDGKRIQSVVFVFPRKMDNGEPTIAPDAKSVEFSCSLNGVKFHVDFDLSKMQGNEGRDL